MVVIPFRVLGERDYEEITGSNCCPVGRKLVQFED